MLLGQITIMDISKKGRIDQKLQGNFSGLSRPESPVSQTGVSGLRIIFEEAELVLRTVCWPNSCRRHRPQDFLHEVINWVRY